MPKKKLREPRTFIANLEPSKVIKFEINSRATTSDDDIIYIDQTKVKAESLVQMRREESALLLTKYVAIKN